MALDAMMHVVPHSGQATFVDQQHQHVQQASIPDPTITLRGTGCSLVQAYGYGCYGASPQGWLAIQSPQDLDQVPKTLPGAMSLIASATNLSIRRPFQGVHLEWRRAQCSPQLKTCTGAGAWLVELAGHARSRQDHSQLNTPKNHPGLRRNLSLQPAVVRKWWLKKFAECALSFTIVNRS
ncbi:hypothetical protein MKZ38_007393 [Zalerion maritima]|uniref:Uncharacterized protein n=1 Tax=Zalerion maritima TaxID=339359 RepID=A0AAD5WN94_9PEZI|nr:hypothetical protein MKZ38_007393 [Zalerion maritima]